MYTKTGFPQECFGMSISVDKPSLSSNLTCNPDVVTVLKTPIMDSFTLPRLSDL